MVSNGCPIGSGAQSNSCATPISAGTESEAEAQMLEILGAARGVEPWTPTGHISRVFFGGEEILVAVNYDDDELRRRQHHGLGMITNRRVLQLLLSMPAGVSVPATFLREQDLRLLQSQPAGVVEISGGEVRVVVTPALRLSSIGVVATTWTRGLRLASPYAAYCARYAVITRGLRAADRALAALDARYYGLGLAEHRDGRLDWLVSPAPFEADRFTAASWLMAERLTAALCGLSWHPEQAR